MRRPSESHVDRSSLSRSAALSLLAAGVAGAAPLRAQTTLTPLRIATPGGDAFAEPFFGADNGFFAKAGYDPQISILNNAGAVLAAVAGGAVDVGLGDIVGIADAIENGIPLVVFAGEFGRTPFAQGSDGRDHNPYGFTVWLAGGGVKKGMAFGNTDEWGYKTVEDKVEIHDLHAVMLHLLGVDHTRLTFRFGGRDMRLTDVHGELVPAILE